MQIKSAIGRWVFLLVLAAPLAAQAAADGPPHFTRTEDVIYARKFGVALTLDVFKPDKPNGRGIVCIISGGWFSSHAAITPLFFNPMLEHGYTVFTVVHGSQPKFTIPEIQQDLHRSVRFIRHNAKKFEIDPDDIGVYGASAGGHLTLTLATEGGPGQPNAPDPIDRESSAVQAAVAFFPPTDFLNFGVPGHDVVGVNTLKQFRPAFGLGTEDPEVRQKLGKQISPADHVHPGMCPILLIHGDADKLVPIQQSQLFMEKCNEVKTPVQLITRPGKGHGWLDIGTDLKQVADWFDKNLPAAK
ncbi:MAG TPA: alpha/beta hydrolase [Tepidisphaeraceae bacterium]|jgi:acetyl esterase/lipase